MECSVQQREAEQALKYAKCGALRKVRQVLDELPVHSVSSWNALIARYVEYNSAE